MRQEPDPARDSGQTAWETMRQIRLRPRPETLFVSQGRTVLACGRDGFIAPGTDQGLYAYQTKLINCWRYSLDGRTPLTSVVTNVTQDHCLGYYIVTPEGMQDTGLEEDNPAQQTVELRLSRRIDGGMHEDVDLTNYTQVPVTTCLQLAIGADEGWRNLPGAISQGPAWEATVGGGTLAFAYQATHCDHTGTSVRISDGFRLRVTHADSPPDHEDGLLSFAVVLPPHGHWHACLELSLSIDDHELAPAVGCEHPPTLARRDQTAYQHAATHFSAPGTMTLTPVVIKALAQARHDLAALRLADLTEGPHAWTVAAGLPMYVALFGRDTLTSAWQAGLLTPDLMRGTIPAIVDWQGRRTNDWLDEAPGRLIHEIQTNREARLHLTPRYRYYGSITTSAFFPVVVSEFWHWTGDKGAVGPMVDAALKGLRWLDQVCRSPRDGFYYYQTRSPLGNRHQGWKDSADAIVDAAGGQVVPPIATSEEQGFVYLAKLHLAEVLWWLGDKDPAKRLYREARELKKRFNEAFWLPDDGYFAMALDAHGRPVRSVGSNAGHCLATAIADSDLVAPVADRLMADDMFSGWGVRTLSSRHPAFNPYSYHRGAVWPVEQGTFALPFMRYGLIDHLHRLTKAQYEAASLFENLRLPELFSGHARSERHPFPALYPQANWPQAWSSSALFCLLQALLGLYPYAPLQVLMVDPHLPDWLPEITLHHLQVGKSRVSLQFQRQPKGHTTVRIIDQQGPSLRVIRQASPWSQTATWPKRLGDLLDGVA
ncbi:MAG: amylo-alpha-1,6-glucosidase [Candidatus Sericytochromatia bacterium]|nr:amylo-alpha-1,6-glucosidase [Candidatus Sericytochromatia bacterium]